MKTVQIIGLGNSLYECKPNLEQDVERWGCQYTWKSHKLTRAFIMDDKEWIVAKNNSLGRNIVQELNDLPFPVYTAHLWGDLERNTEYPLEHVLSCFPNLRHRTLKKTDRGEELDDIQGRYLLDTACYMIALAIFEGFERIELYGMDMANMNGRQPDETWEDERACLNYWIGLAVGRGIEFWISRGSRLTKPGNSEEPNLYGYQTSKHLQKIRDKILNINREMNNVVHSGITTQTPQGNIIDLTNKKIGLAFYRKEDFPVSVKPGDLINPTKSAYYTTDELVKDKI